MFSMLRYGKLDQREVLSYFSQVISITELGNTIVIKIDIL